MMSLYLIGILSAIIVALILKYTYFRGQAVPFVMELPNYRLPVAANVMRLLWDKARDFLQRAFSVIFLASIVIWFLRTFNLHLDMVAQGMEQESILAQISGMAVPLFQPLGFGDWRIVTSLVSGVLAKEVVVSTLSTLFAGTALTTILTPATAYTLLVFCLLYTPCIATIATIRRELGTRWSIATIIFQCITAWIAAYITALTLNTII